MVNQINALFVVNLHKIILITKADEEKKNKTRENMLAKLKLTKKKPKTKEKIKRP